MEALGYIWQLSENTVFADFQRRELERDALVHTFDKFTKPAEQAAVRRLFYPFYSDIVSCLVSAKLLNEDGTPSDTDIAEQLNDYPAKWLEIVTPVARDKTREKELLALHNEACRLNPHWYPPKGETNQTLETAIASTDIDNPDHPDTPDSEEIKEAIEAVAAENEKNAKKKGKSE